MKSRTSTAALVAALAALTLIPPSARAAHPVAPASPGYGPEADYPVAVGAPFVIGGVTYTPADTLNYDAVGYARAGSAGSGISGAHHVLPLPCYVEVTSLDSGHTILVRLDRRGPMNGKQLIELSPAAWAQLGLPPGADAAVRVRRVNPPEPDRALLRTGSRVAERMETPPGLRTALRRKLVSAVPHAPDEPPSATLSAGLAPNVPRPLPISASPVAPKPVASKPVPTMLAPPKPTPAKSAVPTPPTPVAAPKPKPAVPAKAPADKPAPTRHLVVQVAAFANHDHAVKAAEQVGGKVEPAGKLWRVRILVTTDSQAQAALAKAKQSGYAGAMILHGQ